MAMALRLIEDGNQKKAERGFVAEVCRLGPDVKELIADFRKKRTRERAREFLMDKARRCDKALAEKGG